MRCHISAWMEWQDIVMAFVASNKLCYLLTDTKLQEKCQEAIFLPMQKHKYILICNDVAYLIRRFVECKFMNMANKCMWIYWKGSYKSLFLALPSNWTVNIWRRVDLFIVRRFLHIFACIMFSLVWYIIHWHAIYGMRMTKAVSFCIYILFNLALWF